MTTQRSARELTIQMHSQPMSVNMAKAWFEFAKPTHFWMQARFKAIQWLAKDTIAEAQRIGEIGCGNGVVQAQIEKEYGKLVTGIDLDLGALQSSCAERSPLWCYDITCRKSEFKEMFDLIFLCDVIEHLDDWEGFLRASIFHLSPGGRCIINVPARMELYSNYDVQAGHVRRYTLNSLRDQIENVGLKWVQGSYWGLGFYPALAVRKVLLRAYADEKSTIEKGFSAGGFFTEWVMRTLSLVDPKPNPVIGTSIIALVEKA